MKIAAIDRIDAVSRDGGFPITLKQSSSKLPACVQVAVATLAMLAVATPAILLAAYSLADNRSAIALLDRPLSTIALLFGILGPCALLALPLRSGLARLSRSRRVRIERDKISVDDFGLLGRTHWEAKLSAYLGVTYHMRTTLSGPRHEIVLVHPDADKNVMLSVGHRQPEIGVDEVARRLHVDVVSARLLYGRSASLAHGTSRPATIGLKPATV